LARPLISARRSPVREGRGTSLWLPLVTGHHFSHQTGAITMLVNALVR
jgi:hypothetical protein